MFHDGACGRQENKDSGYIGKRAVKIIKNKKRSEKSAKPESHVTTDELGNPVPTGSTGISS